MNEDTLQSADQHQQISLLLPWYLNQSLELTERQQAEIHIHDCLWCRRELVHLRKLAATVKQESDLDVAAEVSFDNLRAKLHAARQPSTSFAARDPGLWVEKCPAGLSSCTKRRHKSMASFLGIRSVRLAIPASVLLAIVPFVMQYGPSPVTDHYQTLSDAKPEAAPGIQLSVVFSKPMSDTEIDALFAQIHGQRIAGPNSIGAYTVQINSGIDAQDLAAAIAFLRGQQNVMLAKPVLPP